ELPVRYLLPPAGHVGGFEDHFDPARGHGMAEIFRQTRPHLAGGDDQEADRDPVAVRAARQPHVVQDGVRLVDVEVVARQVGPVAGAASPNMIRSTMKLLSSRCIIALRRRMSLNGALRRLTSYHSSGEANS